MSSITGTKELGDITRNRKQSKKVSKPSKERVGVVLEIYHRTLSFLEGRSGRGIV